MHTNKHEYLFVFIRVHSWPNHSFRPQTTPLHLDTPETATHPPAPDPIHPDSTHPPSTSPRSSSTDPKPLRSFPCTRESINVSAFLLPPPREPPSADENTGTPAANLQSPIPAGTYSSVPASSHFSPLPAPGSSPASVRASPAPAPLE